MPRTSIKYSNTNFYKVVSKDLNTKHCYVGYTTDFRRRATERSRKRLLPLLNSPNSMLYDFVKKNGGWANFEMVLLETRKCDGVLDAQRIRRTFIEELNATLHGPTECSPVTLKGAFNLQNSQRVNRRTLIRLMS